MSCVPPLPQPVTQAPVPMYNQPPLFFFSLLAPGSPTEEEEAFFDPQTRRMQKQPNSSICRGVKLATLNHLHHITSHLTWRTAHSELGNSKGGSNGRRGDSPPPTHIQIRMTVFAPAAAAAAQRVAPHTTGALAPSQLPPSSASSAAFSSPPAAASARSASAHAKPISSMRDTLAAWSPLSGRANASVQ